MKKIMLFMLSVFGFIAFAGCVQVVETTASDPSILEQVQGVTNPFHIALCMAADPKTSMGINFELPSDQFGYVEYRKIGSSTFLRQTAVKKITDVGIYDVFLYEATLSNLEPGTVYEYRIGGESSSASEIYQFKTAGLTSEETTFMLLSDPQGSDAIDYMTFANNVLNVIEGTPKKVDFAMFTGDLINNNDNRSQWNNFLKYAAVFSTEIPMAATTGNHETGSFFEDQIASIEFSGFLNFPDNGPIYQAFDELPGDKRTPNFDQGKTYSFDYGYAHYVAINSEIFNGDTGIEGTVDESNMTIFTDWLEADLVANQDQWTIVFFHRGPYSLTYDSLNVRTILVPILEEYGVDLVLSGHDHRYARSVIQNGLAVDFTSSDAYARGTVNLVTNSQISRNFNDYSATLGTTYLVGITSGVKFYGDTERTVPEIGYRYTGDVAVIPIVTVSETAIEVTSYIIEKSDDLALFPDAVTLLENFVIRP